MYFLETYQVFIHDIYFVIDLELGTKSIAISPNRMALNEVKELKEQLKDSLKKNICLG